MDIITPIIPFNTRVPKNSDFMGARSMCTLANSAAVVYKLPEEETYILFCLSRDKEGTVLLVAHDLDKETYIEDLDIVLAKLGKSRQNIINSIVDGYEPSEVWQHEQDIQRKFALQIRESLDTLFIKYPELVPVSDLSLEDYLGDIPFEEINIIAALGMAFYLVDNISYWLVPYTVPLDKGYVIELKVYESPIDKLSFKPVENVHEVIDKVTYKDVVGMIQNEASKFLAKNVEAAPRLRKFIDEYLPVATYLAYDAMQKMSTYCKSE